ncbi:MAG: hypothetical protein Pars2KO_02390 [Parasphingorhabdus sp.]
MVGYSLFMGLKAGLGYVHMVNQNIKALCGHQLMRPSIGQKLQIFAQMAHLRLCQLTPDLFAIEKPLSRREMQIIAWAAVGKSNSEIATILQISENSIDSYMRRAFVKLDVHNRTSAAVKAISIDLIRT